MITAQANLLEDQIRQKGTELHTESYSMSIGEVKNLYEEGDLDLHPEFQRFFRWSDEQKFKLIESILLGIPLPSFFVNQREDGVWDVVDGLQRLSTIFEFMGILKDENKKLLSSLNMKGTKYLPALNNMCWFNEANIEFQIPENIKRDFKRKKLDFNIILKQSSDATKYDLFERLNTGSSSATSQEVRNALLIRENKDVYRSLDELSKNENFINSISLPESSLDERFDLELVTRFIVLRNIKIEVLNNTTASDYLTDEIISKANNKDFNWDFEKKEFIATFEQINSVLGHDAFRRFNTIKNKFEGGFVGAAFEIIALGVGNNLGTLDKDSILDRVKNFWKEREEGKIKWTGRNTTSRLQITLDYGRKLFK